MKIKCPSCQAVLNVPDSAAGKVVKCPCGKQLRAPGGSAQPAPAARPAAPTPKRPAPQQRPPTQQPAQQPPAQRPIPQQPMAPGPVGGAPLAPTQPTAGGGFDGGLFDELTDQDLAPVKPVAQPGTRQGPAKQKNKQLSAAMSELEQEEAETRKQYKAGAAKEVWSSIGILMFLGIVNVGMFTYWFIEAESEVEEMVIAPEGEEEEETEADSMLTLFRFYYGANIAIGVMFIVCALLIFQFPMTCSITALVVFIVGEILPFIVVGIIFPILIPFMLLSIRDWVRRVFFIGALLQAINNASYYKFVKTGGRE